MPELREPTHLVPPIAFARAGQQTRLALGFGRRFFLVLFVGLVWLGPAWVEPRFLFAMVLWDVLADRKSTRLNSSHIQKSRMPSSA